MMRRHYLTPVILLAAISLTGLIITQILWLKNSITVSEKQFNDRADRMLEDVLSELKEYSDTSPHIRQMPAEQLIIYDVIDTSLLHSLLKKYVRYHMLDTTFLYALVRTSDDFLIFRSSGFSPAMENDSYKSCLSCIWKKEYIHLSVFFPEKNISIYNRLIVWIIFSFLFLLIISAAFIFVVFNIIRQKKISEIRSDFINNMTHEFKTPISTISLASEILLKDSDNPSSKRVAKYSKIIYEENKRMQSQVELVLQTALIEREKIRLKKETVDIHILLKKAIQSFCIDTTSKKPEFKLELSASNPSIDIDPAHMHNVFSNIIDNAIKYSGNHPVIQINTTIKNNGILIVFTDNGKGISREAQNRIFDKFYRVPTGDRHDVKGFGLGLFYVKTIVEAHQGMVYVQSNLNKGSSFSVFLPVNSSDIIL